MNDHDERGAEIGGQLALLDRILAEPGADHALLDHRELGRQRAGAQQDGEVVGRLDREVARDLPASAQDRLADDRRRDHLVIEHDRERASDVLLRDLRKFARAGGIELEGDDRLAGALVEAGLRVGELLARHDDPLLEQIRLHDSPPSSRRRSRIPAADGPATPARPASRCRPGGTSAWRSCRGCRAAVADPRGPAPAPGCGRCPGAGSTARPGRAG